MEIGLSGQMGKTGQSKSGDLPKDTGQVTAELALEATDRAPSLACLQGRAPPCPFCYRGAVGRGLRCCQLLPWGLDPTDVG